MNSGLRFAAVLIAAIGAAASQADIAYNNFDASGGFNASGNWSVYSGQYLAMPFTSATTGSVTDVIVALFAGANYTAYLELDNDGLNPGTVLETWNFAGTGASETLVGDGSASLVSGNTYWLEITPQTGADDGAWYTNDIGATGTFLFTSGGNWANTDATLSVFRVDTTATPEPVSLSVLGVGLIGAIARRRRAR